MKTPQHWIRSARYDLSFIIAPSFVVLALLVFFPKTWLYTAAMPPWAWVVLVLLIDVSHVYSSLYRTYFDKITRQKHGLLLYLTPILVLISAIILHQLSSLVFWRIAAYLAVYHFVRQQYGFLKLYTRQEGTQPIDVWMIYLATLFPVLYWHLSPPRNFSWFVDGDFYLFENQLLAQKLTYIYWFWLLIYWAFEIKNYIRTKTFNLPKNLLIISTTLTWYLGIVYFNGDMAFTMLNVVAHGVPYMALVYAAEQKKSYKKQGAWKLIFSNFGILFLAILFAFSYIEEGFWDSLVWHEHQHFFAFFPTFQISDSLVLSVIVGLLSIPQLTHYILDGYIWKRGF